MEEKEIINSKSDKNYNYYREPNDFASTIFTTEKALKYFNEIANNKHSQMESLTDAFKTTKKYVWVASFELKDGFFKVPVHISHKKYFKFEMVSKLPQILGI